MNLEKKLCTTITEQIVLGKNYQWILNLGRKFGKKQNICIIPNCFPHRLLISCKRKNSFYTVEKLDKTLTW